MFKRSNIKGNKKGYTLAEAIVVVAVVAIVLSVMGDIFISALRERQSKEKYLGLLRQRKFASRRLEAELGESSISTVTIVQGQYTASGGTYGCDTIAFLSHIDQNGRVKAVDEGDLVYQSEVIFYLDTGSKTLYCQKNYTVPPRPTGAFTPRHSGPNMDQAVARDVLEVRFTDYTGTGGVTAPSGDYIKARLTFEKEGLKTTMERNFRMRKSKIIDEL